MRIMILFFLVMLATVQVKASGSLTGQHLHSNLSLVSQGLLLSGDHWFRLTKKYSLQTPYGEINSFNGDFFVRYEGKRVTVVNHAGELKITLRDGSVIQVPPGFEIWFSEIKKDMKNMMGFIKPVELRDHVPALAKLWNENPEIFKAELLKIQSRWGDRATIAANYYKGLAQRKIASFQKEEGRIQSLNQREINRREANRKLMFERTFGR